MVKKEILKKIQPLLNKSKTLCLSTVSSKGQPESALIYYAADDDLNFYFLTKELTHKKKNLEENSNVSLLMFDEEERQTLQIHGMAEEIINEKNKLDAFNLLIKAASEHSSPWPLPISKVEMGKVCVYKIIPHWMRLANFSEDEGEIFEQLLGK